jgi:hypothetical protein
MDFVKPGKHVYLVRSRLEGKLVQSVNKFLVSVRAHEIPVVQAQAAQEAASTSEELHYKSRTEQHSVFTGLIPDNNETLLQCLKHDLVHLKLERLVDDEKIRIGLNSVLKENYDVVRDIFVCLQTRSTGYPDIDHGTMLAFLQDLKLEVPFSQV